MKKNWKSPNIECLNIAMTQDLSRDPEKCSNCKTATGNSHNHGAQTDKCWCCNPSLSTPTPGPGPIIPSS